MRPLIPQKAPGLLFNTINDQYSYAVNCSHPNSFRVLNKSQYEILKAINDIDEIEVLANRLGLEYQSLERFLQLLSKSELVKFEGEFKIPQKPATPKSLNFWIHTTNACNLGCSYCYISTLNTGRAMQENVRQQLIKKFTEAARTKGIKHIKLRLAGGEPMGQFNAWKSFIAQCTLALKDEACKFDVGFVTNLTLLNDDIIAFSKEHQISYGVSLDGLGTTHDATRSFRSGTGSFEIVARNLKKLIAENVPVSVNTVITNKNLTDLPALTEYLIDLDIPFRYSIVKGEIIDAENLDIYLSASLKMMEDAIATGWQFSRRFQFCDLKPNELGFQTCTSGFSGGAIYIDGTFKYCHVDFGQKNDRDLSIFSTDLDLVDMINSSEHIEEIKSPDCMKCKYRFICTSGCPVYRVNGKDPQCTLYHKFIPMYFELQAKERLKLMHQYEII